MAEPKNPQSKNLWNSGAWERLRAFQRDCDSAPLRETIRKGKDTIRVSRECLILADKILYSANNARIDLTLDPSDPAVAKVEILPQ